MSGFVIEGPECLSCGAYSSLHRDIAADGSVRLMLICPSCGANVGRQVLGKPFIPKSGLDQGIIEMLPLHRDNRDANNRCCVRGCESYETQLHHFSPRHLFGDSCDDWPVDYLCQKHHELWHKLTRTGSFYFRD